MIDDGDDDDATPSYLPRRRHDGDEPPLASDNGGSDGLQFDMAVQNGPVATRRSDGEHAEDEEKDDEVPVKIVVVINENGGPSARRRR